MAIESFRPDRLQNITGVIKFLATFLTDTEGAFVAQNNGYDGGSGYPYPVSRMTFDASRVARTGPETSPASISAYLCIKY
jgi:hypothetical protein